LQGSNLPHFHSLLPSKITNSLEIPPTSPSLNMLAITAQRLSAAHLNSNTII
jgi:hypothetical protein